MLSFLPSLQLSFVEREREEKQMDLAAFFPSWSFLVEPGRRASYLPCTFGKGTTPGLCEDIKPAVDIDDFNRTERTSQVSLGSAPRFEGTFFPRSRREP